MSKPFDVSIDAGGIAPVTFTIAEEDLRQSRRHEVMSAMIDRGDGADERTRLWRGALMTMELMLVRNAEEPIQVFDGSDAYLIPDHAIRSVRLHDPDSPGRHAGKTIGFRRGDEG